MPSSGYQRKWCALLCLAAGTAALPMRAALVPVVTTTNVPMRVMAANITGNSQRYEDFAIRIFQGLKPDVVTIQEFNYLGNTSNDFRALVSTAFGTNYTWFRESVPGYSIPNGVISRWPIAEAGSWDDLELPDRGFAWARIDLPGPNDVYVVSMHLKASTGSSNELRRANEASQLRGLIQSTFPAGVHIVVAGDANLQSPNEAALATLKSFLTDTPIPTDAVSGGDADTNNGRTQRYDYILPSASLNAHRVPVQLGPNAYPNGLVFDSRQFTPETIIPPVLTNDSSLAQHMGVVKDFSVPQSITNFVDVPPPVLRWLGTNVLGWTGLREVAYTVQHSPVLPAQWTNAGVLTSTTTNFVFTNRQSEVRGFFRVLVPE